MDRPSRAQTLMNVAEIFARRGTCDRKQVGAVFAIGGRIIACGYNGAPPGLPHCDVNIHGWQEWVQQQFLGQGRNHWHVDEVRTRANEQLEVHGCRNATHAEANALAFAAHHGVSTAQADLYVTVSPCDTCARSLIAAGIRRVWFLEAYRLSEGIDLLEAAGVKCVAYQPHEG
jgi:dCMP deaminase